MIEAVAAVHAALGPIALVVLLAIALAALVLAALRRRPGGLDLARRMALVLVVAQAAIGLALVVRGGAPSEWIHWLYGAAIIVALLAPASLTTAAPRAQSGLLAGAALLAAIFAWRLWGSG